MSCCMYKNIQNIIIAIRECAICFFPSIKMWSFTRCGWQDVCSFSSSIVHYYFFLLSFLVWIFWLLFEAKSCEHRKFVAGGQSINTRTIEVEVQLVSQEYVQMYCYTKTNWFLHFFGSLREILLFGHLLLPQSTMSNLSKVKTDVQSLSKLHMHNNSMCFLCWTKKKNR